MYSRDSSKMACVTEKEKRSVIGSTLKRLGAGSMVKGMEDSSSLIETTSGNIASIKTTKGLESGACTS